MSPSSRKSNKGAAKPPARVHTLAQSICTAPRLSDAAQARAQVKRWLSELRRGTAGKALRDLLGSSAHLGTVIESLAESSPYLWDLASSDPSRLLRVLGADPDAHLAALLNACTKAVGDTDDEAEAMRVLRQTKNEAALLIALADIGGVWPVMRATRALTDVADTTVASAVRFLLADAVRSGKLAAIDRAAPERGSGYIVIAMGKMGAFELNYSSDIDLIVFFDKDAGALRSGLEPAPFFVRLTQRLVKLLQERTADGYVFRTDLRLRPDPASTAIAVSTSAALAYYEGVGQNWERAAMIKARACAGDIAAGEALLRDLEPFVWRKYLDYVAVADIHTMKRDIHSYKGHAEIAVEGHNIKLGRGGIREVEFFVQTQQLIAGGRHPELRDRQTLRTLEQLAAGGWIKEPVRKELTEAYQFLRTVEHRLQMQRDEQTQELPAERGALKQFARFLGFSDRDAFAEVLLGHLKTVQGHYSRLFAAADTPDRPSLVFPAEADDRKTLDRLSALGFRQPLEASARVRGWLAGSYRPLRGEAARGHLQALLPVLLEHFGHSENPDNALMLFDRFLGGLHGGARLLSLIRQNPDLVALIALILDVAPRLADTLARHPQVMDALVDPSFFGALPDVAELRARLTRSVAQAGYSEEFLDHVRMFGLEYMFLIGVRIVSGTATARQAGEAFARLADAVIRALHEAVSASFVEVYGRLRRQESAVLALGKLGGMEMTAASDLDLILVYDFDEKHPQSESERSLYGGQYFARLTQRLINALTAPTNYGALYQVDMRLRPSGRSGPVATHIDAFEHYQENEAWTWEHMALTRARVLSSSPAFAMRVARVIGDVLQRSRDAELVAGDVVEMRGAIAAEKGEGTRWDLKYAAGGLIDLEFIAQYLQLVHAARLPEIVDTSTAAVLDKAWRLGVLATEDAEVLRPAARLYHDLTQILRLCLSGPFDPASAGQGLLRLLARAADVPDFATLDAYLVETQEKVRASFVRILGKAPKPARL